MGTWTPGAWSSAQDAKSIRASREPRARAFVARSWHPLRIWQDCSARALKALAVDPEILHGEEPNGLTGTVLESVLKRPEAEAIFKHYRHENSIHGFQLVSSSSGISISCI
eukprot:m.335344 g.335344  ORF g.335344 m.335344 type:complete len:111 (+) comp17573_c0_seq1:764-1096(+)